MRGPTFREIRKQFGLRLALAWLATLWRLGLAGPRSQRGAPVTPRRRRAPRQLGFVMRAVEYVVIAIVLGGWSFWAYLIIKGALAYGR